MNDRLVHSPDLKKRTAEVVVRFRVGRIYSERFFVMDDRLLKFALLHENACEIIMRFRVIRPQGHSLTIMGNCLVSFAFSAKSDGQIVMSHPTTRIFSQRSRVQRYGVVINGALAPR